jgi:serine/threonine-protein kinase
VSLRTSSGAIQAATVRIELSAAGAGRSDQDSTQSLPASSSPSRKPLVLGLVVVAAAGAAAFLWSHKPRLVAEPAPVAQAQVSRISVTSTPSDVEVYGDGKLLGRTPFTTTMPVGSPKTHLELKRAGYAVFAKDIDPIHDADVVAVLALDAPSASAPPPAPPATPAPANASPPRRGSPGSHGGAVSRAVAASPPPPPPPPAPAATVIATATATASAPPPPAKKVDPFEDRQ